MPQRPADSACWAVTRLAAYVEAALESCGLTSRQYRMLIAIADGPVSATDLARRVGVAPPSATLMVRGLIQRGIVARTLSSEDQRRVWLSLTKRGGALIERAEAAVAKRLAEVAEGLPGREGPAAIDSLVAWNPALDAFRAEWLARRGR